MNLYLQKMTKVYNNSNNYLYVPIFSFYRLCINPVMSSKSINYIL